MSRVRRGVAGALVVLALIATAAACGDGNGKQSVQAGSKQSSSDTSAKSYVGLTKKEAIARAEASDTTWRILREDEETFPATLDFNPERVNFEIDNGKVTKATNG